MIRIIFITIFIVTFCNMSVAQEVSCEKQPLLQHDYPNSTRSSEKDRMDFLRIELANNPNCIGTIRFQSKKNGEILKQSKKVFLGFLFLGLPMERIFFAILRNSKEEKVEFWTNLPNAEIPNCEECIIIRAKDFPKIEELFKPTIKKRKK